MRRSWVLAAASFALVVAFSVPARAESATPSPSSTEWDETEKRPSTEGRPGEYRTTTTETWMRLTPYFGAIFPEGGLRLTASPMLGLRLDFEPADLLTIGFEVTANIPEINNSDFGARKLTPRDGLDFDDLVSGYIVHPGLYIGLKNPELQSGALQGIVGMGFGAFGFHGYQQHTAAGGAPAVAAFPDTLDSFPADVVWLVHFTVFLRLDIDMSESVKFGIELREHFPLYASGDFFDADQIEPKKFKLGNMGNVITEPSFYFSIAF